MSKRSKKYNEALKMYDKEKRYSLEEALNILKGFPKPNFDETIEVSVKLNLKKSQKIRGLVTFPNIFGNPKRVVVFAKGEKADEAKKAGAEAVGDDDLIEKIKKGWLEFDAAVATPDMMKDVSKLGPILGRRGLMPNPKTGTVTFEIKNAVEEIKKGKSEFKSDKDGVVGIAVGKISMDISKLIDNIIAFYESLKKTRPADAKGEYINSMAISKTMSPGVKIDFRDLSK